MWRATLLASLCVLTRSQVVHKPEPTEHFCRTLLMPGYKMYMAQPYYSKPFRLMAFWVSFHMLVVLIVGPNLPIKQEYFRGAIVQLQCEGQPYGKFVEHKRSEVNEFISCPPGENNTAFHFSEVPLEILGFVWIPPVEMEWDNVTIYSSMYGENGEFWLEEFKLHKVVEIPYPLVKLK